MNAEEPTPPAPLPEGKGEKEPPRASNEDGAQDATEAVTPLPFREGGPGGVGPRGALLCIDYGTKRIGVAMCDPDRVIASPVGTVANDPAADAYFRELFSRNRLAGIVVGLPLHASGAESPMSAAARAFAKRLGVLSGLPFAMWDERHTSHAAETALRDAGFKRQKRKEKVDRVAAQMILQSYLDAGAPPHGSDATTHDADPPAAAAGD